MFTGIVESIGTVKRVCDGTGGRSISVDLAAAGQNVSVGESIAVNGLCLTVSAVNR